MGLRVESGVLHAATGAAVLIQGAVALWLSRLDAVGVPLRFHILITIWL